MPKAWLSRLRIEKLDDLTPTYAFVQFLTSGTLRALTNTSLKYFEFIYYKENGINERRKVHVNDRLSLTSLILVGKVTGNKVVFIRVLVFVLDRTS